MPPPTWQVDGKERFSKLVDFLRKRLGKDHVVGQVCQMQWWQKRCLHQIKTLPNPLPAVSLLAGGFLARVGRAHPDAL